MALTLLCLRHQKVAGQAAGTAACLQIRLYHSPMQIVPHLQHSQTCWQLSTLSKWSMSSLRLLLRNWVMKMRAWLSCMPTSLLVRPARALTPCCLGNTMQELRFKHVAGHIRQCTWQTPLLHCRPCFGQKVCPAKVSVLEATRCMLTLPLRCTCSGVQRISGG